MGTKVLDASKERQIADEIELTYELILLRIGRLSASNEASIRAYLKNLAEAAIAIKIARKVNKE